MKLCKYYSLDECSNREKVISHLESLQEDSKIYFDTPESEIIKITDTGLSTKETKELINFLNENDIIDYPDYMNEEENDEDYEEEENDEY